MVVCAGGMPDLLLWHTGEQRAKASEVKGPRDRLSEQQRAWAAALSAGGLDVEVCILKTPWSMIWILIKGQLTINLEWMSCCSCLAFNVAFLASIYMGALTILA